MNPNARPIDDFPGPRWLQLGGKMDGLSDGAHKLPDLRGQVDAIRSVVPADLRTAGQKRRYCRDRAILAGKQAGMSYRQLAREFGLDHSSVVKIVQRHRRRVGLVG